MVAVPVGVPVLVQVNVNPSASIEETSASAKFVASVTIEIAVAPSVLTEYVPELTPELSLNDKARSAVAKPTDALNVVFTAENKNTAWGVNPTPVIDCAPVNEISLEVSPANTFVPSAEIACDILRGDILRNAALGAIPENWLKRIPGMSLTNEVRRKKQIPRCHLVKPVGAYQRLAALLK